MKARMATVAGTALGTLGLLGTFAAPAAAAPQRNCAVNLDTGAVTCASSEDRALRAVGAQASLVIARTYTGANYTGTVLAWVQNQECTPAYDAELQWDDLRSTAAGDLNNRISSVHTYHQCDVKLFDGINFTGASSTWIDQAPVLGNIGDGWGNRAGSIKFS
ncbi:peptidase inhibitor family I36 protein [Micromonospora sp. NPDC002296]|uniref:peptidase inhibitor family I36 protein n=1 Tax=Micromonospora sp. NPDC002296 TaxID=3154271 RepID=UPI00331F65F7